MRVILSALLGIALNVAAAEQLDLEMMTWPEVKMALQKGKTIALVYNGGTEQRGPQCVTGGHNLMGKATVLAIAKRLENAIAAPVIPFSVNDADPKFPGTIGITESIYGAINEQVTEQLIKNGFRSVVLMGDHGGGQKQLEEVAKKLEAKYASQGIHVVYCGDVYEKAQADFNKWLEEHGYPTSYHAGIPDTSEMLYLGGDRGWVRKDLISSAVGVPVPKSGEKIDETKATNGIVGDARRSSEELGKRLFDMKVDYAVRQIKSLLTPK